MLCSGKRRVSRLATAYFPPSDGARVGLHRRAFHQVLESTAMPGSQRCETRLGGRGASPVEGRLTPHENRLLQQ